MKRLTKNNINGRLFVGSAWISNGHWGATKAALDPYDVPLVATQEIANAAFRPDEDADRPKAIDRSCRSMVKTAIVGVEFRPTDWVWTRNLRPGEVRPAEVRRYASARGSVIFINETYARLFEYPILRGSQDNPLAYQLGDVAFVIMPIRSNEKMAAMTEADLWGVRPRACTRSNARRKK